MHVTRLDLRNLRRFDEVSIRPERGVNVLIGGNGAGKSSVLEALHLMAYGRSFRGRVRDGLVRSGASALEVFAEWQEPAAATGCGDGGNGGLARVRRAGLRHSGQEWSGRLDGEPTAQLGDLLAALAVVTFEPGSHALISGSAETRRRFLDWGLFHVEPDFMPAWRRYARALRQRNALLKSRAADSQLDAWDHELAQAGELISSHRENQLALLQPRFRDLLLEFAPVLGDATMEYVPGWRRHELPLVDALLLARGRDQQAGFTSVGPHRADWRAGFSALPGREALSRGQTKLVALAALLAQATELAETRGDWPVVALDDLASELDRVHQERVVARLVASGAQVWITGTELPVALTQGAPDFAMFHVEHGGVERR